MERAGQTYQKEFLYHQILGRSFFLMVKPFHLIQDLD